MRRKIKYLAAVLLCAWLAVLFHLAAEYLNHAAGGEVDTAGRLAEGRNQNRILLDPGHGGMDGGKTGVNGVIEKDVNLRIASEVKVLLEAQGFEVLMTRDGDERLGDSQVEDLKKRTEMINRENAVLTVSIHQNSYHEEYVRGAQVFYYTDSREGEDAARIIQEKLNQADPDHKKEAKANDAYYILKNTKVPVVIVECGFLSNCEEAELLSDEEYCRSMAEIVAGGILEFVRS